MKKIRNKDVLKEVFEAKEGEKMCQNPKFKPNKPKQGCRPHDLVDTKGLDHEIHELLRIYLTVEVDEHEPFNFKYRLTTNNISFPLFNYDSHGLAHTDKRQPMHKWIIECPHFNFYDKNGIRYAYKIAEMKVSADDFMDYNKAFPYFLREANTKTGGAVPSVEMKPQLPCCEKTHNPLEGINFK